MVIRVRGSRTTGAEIPRLLLLLVTTSVGWIIIGTGLLIGGLIWGLNSHTVAYVQGGQGLYHAYLSDDNGFILFQQEGTDKYYVMHIPDYTPFVDTATILSDMHSSNAFSFIASTNVVTINAQIRGTGTFVNTAHPIEKVVFYSPNHQSSLTYVNAEYSGNPNGYTINNWPYASLLIAAGALCIGGGLFFILRRRHRQKQDRAAQLAALETAPSPFARELGEG